MHPYHFTSQGTAAGRGHCWGSETGVDIRSVGADLSVHRNRNCRCRALANVVSPPPNLREVRFCGERAQSPTLQQMVPTPHRDRQMGNKNLVLEATSHLGGAPVSKRPQHFGRIAPRIQSSFLIRRCSANLHYLGSALRLGHRFAVRAQAFYVE